MAGELKSQVLSFKKYLERYFDKTPDETKVLNVFRKLDKMQITLELLQETGIGKAVNHFRKYEGSIGDRARAIVLKWKGLLPATASLKCETVSETNYSHDYVNKRMTSIDSYAGPRMDSFSPEKLNKKTKDEFANVKIKQEKVDTKEKGHSSHDSHRHSRKDKDKSSKHSHHSSSRSLGSSGSSSRNGHSSHSSSKIHQIKKEKIDDGYQDGSSYYDNAEVKTETMEVKIKKEPSEDEMNGVCNFDTSMQNVKIKKEKVSTSDTSKVRQETDLKDNSDHEDENPTGMSFEDFLSYDTVTSNKTKKRPSSTANKSSASKERSGSSRSNHSKDTDRKQKKESSERKDDTSSKSSSSKHHSKDSRHHSSHKSSKSSHHSSSKSSSSKHTSSSKDKHRHDKKRKHSGSSKEAPAEKCRKQDESQVKFEVPPPSASLTLSHSDIMSTLPEISPNYKPLPHVDMGSPSRRKSLEVDPTSIGSKKYSRTQVYSGRKQNFLSAVPTLYNACLRVLMDNIDMLDFVGGVPCDILKPVLEKCTASQLYNLEDSNPQFLGETDDLWEGHCKKDFKGREPESEFESWRELYIRLFDEREAKLKKLTEKMSANIARAKPIRTTKLAYVESAVKPPRDVLRKQMKYGTAGSQKKRDPLEGRVTSHGKGTVPIPKVPIPKGNPVERIREKKPAKSKAPMMQKTLKLMNKLPTFRR